MPLTYRQLLDQKYEELRKYKRGVFASIFRYGRCKDYKTNPKWAGFSITDEIAKMEDRFLRWNQWLIAQCETNGNFRQAAFDKCSDGIEGKLFWFDSFLHTYAPKRDNPNVKWVTRPIQERYIRWRHETVAMQKHGLCDKSRDVGASWCNCYDDLWWWLFDEFGNGNFLLGSYKEEYVDGKSDKALMPKIDYALRKLPVWQVPDGYREAAPWRTFKAIKHPLNQALIEGEATNPNFGRGGRKRVVDFDEFPFWKDAEKAKRSAGMNSSCLMFTGTPNGMGNSFAEMRWASNIRRFCIRWTWNPEYQEGRYYCQPGCIVHPEGHKPHSAKYDQVCAETYHWNPMDIAQELDIDYIRSAGTPVFNVDTSQRCMEFLRLKKPQFERIKLSFVAPEKMALSTTERNAWFKAARKWKVKAEVHNGGRLKVFKRPMSCKNPACLCKGSGLHTYIAGGDPNQGHGHGDNSVLYIADLTLGEVVAEWEGRAPHEETGIDWALACKWYGTASGHWRDAFAAIESNVGLAVLHVMEKMGIPLFQSASDAKTKRVWEYRLGVVIHPQNKYRLLQEYLVPILNNLSAEGYPILRIPFIEFFQETTYFITHANAEGEINPEKPKCGAMRGKHDDRVMAMLCLVYGAMMHYGKIRGHISEPKFRTRSDNMNVNSGTSVLSSRST